MAGENPGNIPVPTSSSPCLFPAHRVVLSAAWAGFEALCRRFGSEGCVALSMGGISGKSDANAADSITWAKLRYPSRSSALSSLSHTTWGRRSCFRSAKQHCRRMA
ncbi:unnamed protein product [Closterium sp. Naga37s-1]|nr:unnamed protein product [Closterium sp. Naga37s-1]